MMSHSLQNQNELPSLSPLYKLVLGGLSLLLVAFGQPAWWPLGGLLAACGGYALFFRILLDMPSISRRFLWAFLWFFCVQLVQVSWFLSHPFWYIYSVYFFIAIWLGLQFGCLALFIPNVIQKSVCSQRQFLNYVRYIRPQGIPSLCQSIGYSAFIASVWAIFEWSRLYFLSGLSWNPIGLALTSNVYALQMASLWGVFGLSFWVMFVNMLALSAWMSSSRKAVLTAVWLTAAATPYLYGLGQVALNQEESSQHLTTMLVQTAFPTDKTSQGKGIIQSVIDQWRQILLITANHREKAIDLVVLPEYVVPFGTYSHVYPLNVVMDTFIDVFHPSNLDFFPHLDHTLVAAQHSNDGMGLFVNNAYWIQTLANYFEADVVAGLEDAERVSSGAVEHYSAAQFTHPQKTHPPDSLFATRYAKRVLVPMGEYIPFSFCKEIAQRYGVFGSFTCGQEAVVMTSKGIPFSPSICYEETFGDLIREGKQKGARLLVNLTSDVWYPESKLPQQHFDHARLRTVENGVPLVRACNTGVTAAVDSLGRTLAVLGGAHPEKVEWVPDALVVKVPIHTYETPYARFGDKIIIGLSLLIISIAALTRLSSLINKGF